MHVTFSQKTKVESVNRVIKTCSLDLETYFKYFVLLYSVLLGCRTTQIFCHGATKTKKYPCTMCCWFFGNVLILLTAPQGLKIHTINIFKYQIFLTGFRWAKIFRHGATRTSFMSNPAKSINNDQLLLKKLRNNEKTLCSSLSYNIITNLGLSL